MDIFRKVVSDENGDALREGDVMRRPILAQTLRRIAEEGADVFYNGSLADDIVADIQDLGKMGEGKVGLQY